MVQTIFDKIVSGEIPSHIVWQDEKHIAFLTPFPNTPGFTVVIPKVNPGDYVFSIDNQVYIELMAATKKVAKILEMAFNTPRIALVFEGTGVAHVHAKLIPLHGKLAAETDVWSKDTEFVEEYRGFITTMEGPRMSDDEMNRIHKLILGAQK
jgi:histidine triad (HIT) family protein